MAWDVFCNDCSFKDTPFSKICLELNYYLLLNSMFLFSFLFSFFGYRHYRDASSKQLPGSVHRFLRSLIIPLTHPPNVI